MNQVNTFRLDLIKLAEEGLTELTEEKKTLSEAIKKYFTSFCENAQEYRKENTYELWKEEEPQFEKKYLVLNSEGIVISFHEKYRTVDEKLRNRPMAIFIEQIAEAEMELENIVIDLFSTKPSEEFNEFVSSYIKHITEAKINK